MAQCRYAGRVVVLGGIHGFRGASWRGLGRHVVSIENTTFNTTISLTLDRNLSVELILEPVLHIMCTSLAWKQKKSES